MIDSTIMSHCITAGVSALCGVMVYRMCSQTESKAQYLEEKVRSLQEQGVEKQETIDALIRSLRSTEFDLRDAQKQASYHKGQEADLKRENMWLKDRFEFENERLGVMTKRWRVLKARVRILKRRHHRSRCPKRKQKAWNKKPWDI